MESDQARLCEVDEPEGGTTYSYGGAAAGQGHLLTDVRKYKAQVFIPPFFS